MENTGEKLQSQSTSQITEIVCSVVMLICLFLPWVTMYRFSVSAYDLIVLATKVEHYSPYAQAPASAGGSSLFAVFIFIQLLLYIINAIVQYMKCTPWLSFYTAWVPATMGFMILYKTTVGGSDEYFGGGFLGMDIGAGALLSLLAGLIMQFSAWTTIGIHHKKYRGYFLTALIWCIAGWVWITVGLTFVSSNSESLLDLYTDYNSSLFVIILLGLIWFLAFIGIGHTLWLIYGGIVMLCSSDNSSATPAPAEQSAQIQADEALNEVRSQAAYQPSTYASASEPEPVTKHLPEQEIIQTSSDASDDPFGVVKESWTTKPQEEPQNTVELKYTETVVPPVQSSKNGSIVLISIIVCVLLTVGGTLGYFFWYAPYAKDRDALRTYVVANNVFLRSSKLSGVEYNILGKIPYGTEVITYEKYGEWADVKVNKQVGAIAAAYLLDSADFTLLNGVWSDNEARECIESSKCRLAILDFLKTNHLPSGQNGYQIYTRPANQKPNTVFYPRLYDKYSKYTDFVFLLSENKTGNRTLVCYSFDNVTEKPIFRFSIGAPQSGYIKNIVNRNGSVRVTFDNNKYLNFSLQ